MSNSNNANNTPIRPKVKANLTSCGYTLEFSKQVVLTDETNQTRANFIINDTIQFDIDISFLKDPNSKKQIINKSIDPEEACIYIKLVNWGDDYGSNNDIITKKTEVCTIDGYTFFFELWVHNCNCTGNRIVLLNLYSKPEEISTE